MNSTPDTRSALKRTEVGLCNALQRVLHSRLALQCLPVGVDDSTLIRKVLDLRQIPLNVRQQLTPIHLVEICCVYVQNFTFQVERRVLVQRRRPIRQFHQILVVDVPWVALA